MAASVQYFIPIFKRKNRKANLGKLEGIFMKDQNIINQNDEVLFTPIRVGAIELPSRVIMAPLTRNRAGADNVPTDLMAKYYAQRATAGLIISEATQICPEGQGYSATPGIHSSEQIAGWKRITAAVHAKGGRIVLQLWHVGRISHTSLQPNGQAPVAPSAIRANAQVFAAGGFVDVSMPRALALSEIPTLVETYRQAANNAKEAGFDGVEIHAANGYLLDQFLRDRTNQRNDAYGGNIENRIRLLSEVCEAAADAIGADRVGVRLSPLTSFGDIADSNPQTLFNRVVARLAELEIAFVHVIEGETGGERNPQPFDYAAMRGSFPGTWIVNNGYDRTMAIDAVAGNQADAVAFGRSFIANPDLPRRLRENTVLNLPDPATFYGGDAHGYTDYPALE
ncbi:N-ethylmaleimide reductase [Nitrosomonas mobilis]|uniref:N-ethylmaleimide reductase n=2 Tax=Nitrosomonas mobilis TaxID=51642 RepID=A0A1G5SBS2_9PROT|nr:N-ethylmaleimide reductase [Nitrosomonas mobilis]